MAYVLRVATGYPRHFTESASPTIYDESVALASPVNAGVSYTLPNSGSYEGDELEIYLDGQVLDSGLDFTFVGTGVKTQVQFTFNLLAGDNIRFRKIRGA
jgi:hypothetical protein